MNTWFKSILTGAIATAALLGLQQTFLKKRSARTYHADYVIKAGSTDKTPLRIPDVIELLENRMKAAGYNYKISSRPDSQILISLSHVSDTQALRRNFTAAAKLEFREVYTARDLAPLVSMADSIATEIQKSESQKNDTAVPERSDTISREVAELLEKMDTHPDAGESRINFQNPTYEIVAAEAGTTKVQDTGWVRKLFESDPIRQSWVPGMQLAFEEADQARSKNTATRAVRFYFLRKQDEQLLLDNKDIMDAQMDYSSEGKVFVTMQFTSAGTQKWRTLTRKNTGRPIAIVLDGRVVSAPTVESEITGGVSTISGAYTPNEAIALSEKIRASPLPLTLEIISSSIMPESSTALMKKTILFLILAFIFLSGLAFLLFKILIPNNK